MAYLFKIQNLKKGMAYLLKTQSFLLICLFPSLCFGKIYIEPYLGYSFTIIAKEQFSRDFAKAQGSTEKALTALSHIDDMSYYHGITPGTRLGYSYLNFAVGVDFNAGYWKSLYKSGLNDFANMQTVVPVMAGFFASYKLPLLFRAYATFIPPIAHLTIKTQDVSSTCKASQGLKLGVSYLSLPFLSINMEYLPMKLGGSCDSWSYTGTIYGNITF